MQVIIGKMAKMYPMFIMVGFAIVIVSFLIGANNSAVAAQYFAQDKVTRETTLLAQRAAFESTEIWLPTFKFLGLGLILGGIVMALRVIIDHLRNVGYEVLPPERHAGLPKPPWYGLLMPVVMMLGEVIFIIALIVGLNTAAIASDLFANNSLPTLDAAGAGSALLGQVQAIYAVEGWLVPLKFFGVATEFLAIMMGLATIIYILNRQTEILDATLAEEKAQSGQAFVH